MTCCADSPAAPAGAAAAAFARKNRFLTATEAAEILGENGIGKVSPLHSLCDVSSNEIVFVKLHLPTTVFTWTG